MTHLYVIPGHGAGDPGSIGNGYQEAERVRALANRIKALGGDNVTLADTSRNYYADNGISSLSIPKDWQIIELHMDSAKDSSAKGGHVIINSTLAADQYDKALANFISNYFPGRSVIISKRSDLANPKRAAAKGYPYRLIELCFISNPSDLTKFNANMDAVAAGILSAFGIKANGSTAQTTPPVSSSPNTAPSKPAATQPTTTSNFGGTYRCTVNNLRVRTGPGLGYAQARDNSGAPVYYNKGNTVNLDNWYKIADGYVWGRYTGASSGQLRYVAVGKATGKPEANDYLIKVK